MHGHGPEVKEVEQEMIGVTLDMGAWLPGPEGRLWGVSCVEMAGWWVGAALGGVP